MITKNIEHIVGAAISNKAKDRNKYTPISKEELNKLITTDYKEAFDAYSIGYKIYRGDYNLENRGIEIAIATPGNRVSQHTSNIYTKLTSDIIPSWKAYPRRNNSFICTGNDDKASEYADSYNYIILPKNGAKIGVCSEDDFWDSFPYLRKTYHISNANLFNKEVAKFLNNVTIFLTKEDGVSRHVPNFCFANTDNFIKYFNQLDSNIRSIMSNSELKDKFLMELQEHLSLVYPWSQKYFACSWIDNIMDNKSSVDFFDYILDPDRNYFNMVSISNLSSICIRENELWTDSECIFMNEEI